MDPITMLILGSAGAGAGVGKEFLLRRADPRRDYQRRELRELMGYRSDFGKTWQNDPLANDALSRALAGAQKDPFGGAAGRSIMGSLQETAAAQRLGSTRGGMGRLASMGFEAGGREATGLGGMIQSLAAQAEGDSMSQFRAYAAAQRPQMQMAARDVLAGVESQRVGTIANLLNAGV